MAQQSSDQPADPIANLRGHLSEQKHHGMVERCRDGGRCHLVLDLASVCISCDATYLLAGHRGKRPDFFVAASRPTDDRFCWAIIEMKSGGMDIPDLQAQLQGGADCLEQSDLPTPKSCDVLPLVLRGRGGVRVSDRLRFDRYKVTYRGVKRTILIEHCGTTISATFRHGEGST